LNIAVQRPFRPTKPDERIVQIDILRGFALFGVLLVNVFEYNASFFDFSGFYKRFRFGPLEWVWRKLTYWGENNKYE
jgi:uncharacterized membrane protein YeiB